MTTDDQRNLSALPLVAREGPTTENEHAWAAAYGRACDVIAAYEQFDDVVAALSDARREKYRKLEAAKERFRG